MLAALLIVLREVLEAALIVGIVLAATEGIAGRGRWIAGGIAAGLAGAGLVAAFAGAIAGAIEGTGQELFNAGVLLTAVAMLGWHNVWMARHGRELAAKARAVGSAVMAGERPLYALASVCGLAVMREGSEVVLFLYGVATEAGAAAIVTGGLLGLLAGIAVGALLYLGLLRIPAGQLFAVTGWLILLLAAGLAGQAAAYLLQAGYLPALGEELWDTSWLLSEHGVVGNLLHALVGYAERPSGIQVLAYALALVVIGGAMRLTARDGAGDPQAARAPVRR